MNKKMNFLQVTIFAYVLFARHSNDIKMKEIFKSHPNDPTLDCYLDNNSSWVCHNRTDFIKDVDSDDSY